AGLEKPGILWRGDEGNAAIAKAFGPDSFDILLVHGGEEWSTSPSAEYRALYRSYIDLGADAVIGSHPHVLQGIEIYKGSLIAYSLGNFVFPGMDETEYGEDSLILGLGIEGQEVRYVDMTPVRIDGKHLNLDDSGYILSRVLEETQRLNTR
ncbi:MAG: CapA family protein, partial [Spirochaetales bacterium]|nr:CapA family protein [Spirochaetales bacterium]